MVMAAPPPQLLGLNVNGTPGAGNPSTPAKVPLPGWVPDWLSENPIFSAGFGLFGMGVAVQALRSSSHRLVALAGRRMLTTLEVPSKDHAYPWVMQSFIAHNKHSARHLGVETFFSRDVSGHATTSFDFIPSPGRHWMKFRSHWVKVERNRETSSIDLQMGAPWETLTLTTAIWNRHILEELLIEARDHAVEKQEGKTTVFHSVGQDWRPFGCPKRIRPFESVILPAGVAEEIEADVLDFLRSDQWYVDRGIPYRRGYLLYGPPGCGKSSFVMALAGRIKYNICILNVSDPYMTDSRLNYLLATVPPRCLVLLEDIDGAVKQQEIENDAVGTAAFMPGGNLESEGCSRPGAPDRSNPYGTRQHVTYSGLLNALDGVVATEERIVFMTTNHLNRLPGSLVRPGRVDLKVFVGWASQSQLKRMFLRFYPQELELADEFCALLQHVRLSMAEVQAMFKFCKQGPQSAVDLARRWGRERVPQGSGSQMIHRVAGSQVAGSEQSDLIEVSNDTAVEQLQSS